MNAGFEQIKDLFASENGSADEMKAQVQSLDRKSVV